MQKFIQFLFIFSLAWLIVSLFQAKPEQEYTDDIVLFLNEEYSVGSAIQVQVLNNTDKTIALKNDCSQTPLLTEKYIKNGEWEKISTARKSQENCKDPVEIPSKEKRIFSYANESYELFGETGKYKVSVEYNEKTFSQEFGITPPGFFKTLWNTLVYKPIYNLLIWLIEVMPGHSLGLGIILLTVIVKTALLLPNHKALKSQKALQKIQPELQKIKEKYKGDQARIAQETMKIWKKHKVNPAGSCLPLLLQFPFLIAIFFTLQNGLSENNVYLLYDAVKHFDFSLIDPSFLAMDLTHSGPIVLGLIVGGLQFFQMKLTFAHMGKKKKDENQDMMAMQMMMMNKMFTYIMPAMVAIFTLTLPAGVGIYWGASTLFAIGQQYFVNLK